MQTRTAGTDEGLASRCCVVSCHWRRTPHLTPCNRLALPLSLRGLQACRRGGSVVLSNRVRCQCLPGSSRSRVHCPSISVRSLDARQLPFKRCAEAMQPSAGRACSCSRASRHGADHRGDTAARRVQQTIQPEQTPALQHLRHRTCLAPHGPTARTGRSSRWHVDLPRVTTHKSELSPTLLTIYDGIEVVRGLQLQPNRRTHMIQAAWRHRQSRSVIRNIGRLGDRRPPSSLPEGAA